MKPVITIKNLTFTYAGRVLPTLNNINYTIRKGEFILLTGATGCGKSTLMKTLNGLIPQESGGTMQGTVCVGGIDTRQANIADVSRLVGLVFQNPEDQIFSATVEDETAFVLENMGLPEPEIRETVCATLQKVGLAGKEKTSIHALSGGQKQRLAVAAVLAAQPEVLALDEPISQLDPSGAEHLLKVLKELNEQGVTVIVVEHRLHEVLPICSRVTIMDEGTIVWDSSADQAIRQPDIFIRHGLRLPQPIEICHKLGIKEAIVSVTEAVQAIKGRYDIKFSRQDFSNNKLPGLDGVPNIQVKELVFGYDEKQPPLINGLNFTAYPGEIIALMGTNGAGKSTLLQQMAGLLKPWQGEVSILDNRVSIRSGKIGMVLQNPDLMLFNPTVEEEILFGSRQQGSLSPEQDCDFDSLLTDFDLRQHVQDFPLALSRGQRLRTAIASVLACNPAVLLLDEPTTGQDIAHIRDIETRIRRFTQGGGTVVLSTHDGELAASLADRIIVMNFGEIIMDANPSAAFSKQEILQTAALKLPPVIELAQALGLGPILAVEEVVRYVRQASVGSNNSEYHCTQIGQ